MSELNIYHHELRPDEYDEVYLKSEADKVIAEKDKELRHQKYKRCLDKADYAMYHHFRMLYIYGKSLDNDKAVFKINYGLRWRSRWLALAYQFKEAR